MGISYGMLGKKHSRKTKIIMSNKAKLVGTGKWNKGRKFTEEHKRKIGEAQMGNKSHRYGKKLSLDELKKRSLAVEKGYRIIRLWETDIRKMDLAHFKLNLKGR